eukprot:3625260-Prymnesium_polylepis.1
MSSGHQRSGSSGMSRLLTDKDTTHWDGLRRIWSASTALDLDRDDRFVSVAYGAMQRTHSNQSISALSVGGGLSRADSFKDLPPVALAGMGSRVSRRGSIAAPQPELERFIKHGPTDDIDW